MIGTAKSSYLRIKRFSAGAALLLLGCLGIRTGALEPPKPGQIEQYRQDGTLAERIAAAQAFGNHKVAPHLALDARNRLHKLMTGEDHSEAFTPPTCWQGGLPASGNPKILTLLIAFSDTPPVAGDTQPLIASKLFGDGTDGPPYDSLRNFYRRSSYNQLDIAGNALGWYTTAYPRSSVPETDTGRENLIKEALSYYDAQGHDFSQYDNDGDGTIESFSVIWTGTHGAWASFWWGYYTGWGDWGFTLDGKHLSSYSWQWESYDYPSGLFEPSTIIHETGHALGLPDYYDYDGSVGPDGGVGGLDQMDGYGDHNCFSKFLLDWISPTVCDAGGAHIATLHPSESSQDAIIAMPDASGGAFEEYFMIQVRNRTQNDVWYPTDGILIWHVDARLDAGNCDYRYNNSYTAHKLLRLMEADGLEEIERGYGADAGDYYTQGDSFSNTTTPNSKRYDGTPTGLTVNAISAYADPMTFNLDCAACIVSCTASAPATGTTGVSVAFQSTATFSPAGCGTPAFAWDFDNNGTTDSTFQNPSHAYAAAGTFTWKLTVTGTNTTETCVKTGTIVVSPPCMLTCTATVPSQGSSGVPTQFRSAYAFSPNGCGTAQFQWDFDGNGSTDSTAQNPTHTYATPGTYTWTLTVSGTNGSGTCAKTGTITIVVPCTLSCSATVPGTSTVGQPVAFQSAATPAGCTGSPSYAWTFGDGGTSSLQNPTHTYATPGNFGWSLTVTLQGASCTQNGSITISESCSLQCDATVPPSGVAGIAVPFQSTTTPSGCTGTPSFAWTFGDGGTSSEQNPTHAYDAAGTYAWSLTVTVQGATCAQGGSIVISPPCALECSATVPTSAIVGSAVPFQSTATPSHCDGAPTFAWSFGDGDTSSVQNPSHAYSEAGTYAWSLTVTVQGVTCIRSGSIVVSPPCTLECAATVPPSGVVGTGIPFQGTATSPHCAGTPTFAWTFGDGDTSSEQSPTHAYASAGTFAWNLTVVVDGVPCTQSGAITVEPLCTVTCSATAPTSGVAGQALAFQAAATPTDCLGTPTYAWTFGDGATSAEQNPSRAYPTAGSYSWSLTVTVDGATCTQAGTVAVESGLPGDGDGDGSVSIGEVQQAINMFLGVESPEPFVDCDSSGAVTIGEVQKVINAFLGLPSSC